MNTLEKIGIIFVCLFASTWAVELLNYKDWLSFGGGLFTLALCCYIIVKILFTILKNKIK